MAQLKDTLIQGDLRITENLYSDSVYLRKIYAPSTAGGSLSAAASKILKTDSSGNILWATEYSYSLPTGLSNLNTQATNSTTGFLKKTGANTWTIDTSTYVTSSGVTSITPGSGLINGTSGSSQTAITTSGTLTVVSAPKLQNTSQIGDTNHPVYFSASGVPVQTNSPSSGSWFKGIPLVGSDGVMEIGKYIDFHATSATTADNDARITARNSSDATDGAGLTLSGTTVGSFKGSLTGNASSASSVAWTGVTGRPTHWANIELQTAAAYDKTPVLSTIALGGTSSVTAGKIKLEYNTSTKALDFNFI